MKAEFAKLEEKKVLVIGGTGFIGSRLVEKLFVDCGAEVRVLVRNPSTACRIARFPVELVPGDATNADDVARAVTGCELVIQCSVPGTLNVLEACKQAGIRRLVYLSSLMVYGVTADGDLDESAERRSIARNPYAQQKFEAEAHVLDFIRNHSFPAVIIQPTGVYGPYSKIYCRDVIAQLKQGRVILVNGGEGYFNPVYIDDLVTAILLAMVRDEALGEDFLISEQEPVTWKKFYGTFENILGVESTVSMNATEAEVFLRERAAGSRPKPLLVEMRSLLREYPDVRKRLGSTREASWVKRVIKTVLRKKFSYSSKPTETRADVLDGGEPNANSAKPVGAMYAADIPFYASKTVVRIDKARKLLGYEPVFDFETGMGVTEEWLRWSRLT